MLLNITLQIYIFIDFDQLYIDARIIIGLVTVYLYQLLRYILLFFLQFTRHHFNQLGNINVYL